MDVAVFVGFAARGPLHTPIVVEDVAQVKTIFGEDLPLAWDESRGETVYAYLAPTVRAFFRNGGRRCWVIRVAGHAQYNTFRIPGLKQVHLYDDGKVSKISDAFARASSEGCWSDALRVAAALLSQTHMVEHFSLDKQQVDLTLTSSQTTSALVAGDLLRLTFRKQCYRLLFVVQAVHNSPPSGYVSSAEKTEHVRIKGKTPVWFLLLPDEESHSDPPSPEIIAELNKDHIDCERLTFELWVMQNEAYPIRLSNLGFVPEHPFYWDALPTDEQLYMHTETLSAQSATDVYAGLWSVASNPRFPLAGKYLENSFSIPLAMPVRPKSEQFATRKPQSGTPLERNGLSRFEDICFLDPDLRESAIIDLLARADFIRYQSSSLRALWGIHAALEIEEATLIVVPDALHRGWHSVAREPQWRLNTSEEYAKDTLLVVQRALLRMCAARGDLFAVLALPEHYREDAAIEHVATLTASLDNSDANALNYGAIYHPWLHGRETEIRHTPPDGAMCGIVARRAIVRDAWIAPANEALHDVVALTPMLHRDHRLRLQEAQINLIRQEPRGFLTLSADTLSSDPDLRPINVRRLLILLRRMALLLGVTYVFEPNSDAFRRLLQHNFEAMLEQMFIRGAFAGSTPQTSFQVVIDNTLNTAQHGETDGLIVELRIAPSLPMTFLTLRLVQTHERGRVTEEH
jgi:hypothetical protein